MKAWCLLAWSSAQFSYLFCTSQDHSLGSSTTRNGLVPLTSTINEENAYRLAYSQSDGGQPSIESPSLKIILAFVKLAENCPAQQVSEGLRDRS